jgi:phospholipid N-methyltransferase
MSSTHFNTQALSLSTETITLQSTYLMEVATARAAVDAGVQNVAFTWIDHLVHFVFQYIFFIFYPAYDRFYYEMQIEAFTHQGKELPAYESYGFREAVLFIHRFFHSPSTIGSIFPSSRGLVNAITKKVAEAAKNPKPQRYLEIGAGTGSFTEGMISQMKETDHLDVVEYDADLCYLLRRRFRHLKNVAIHHVSIFDYQAKPYDVVVSGLPLMNFSPDFVEKAHKKYVDLTKSGGFFSYFEYIGLSSIKQPFLFGETAREFQQVLDLKRGLVEKHGKEIDNIWWNVTPARAVHCSVSHLREIEE